MPDLLVHLGPEAVQRVENHLLSFTRKWFRPTARGDLAHLPKQILQDGSLPALLPVEGDRRNKRDRRSECVRRLAVQFEQLRTVWTVVALLNRFDFNAILLRAPVERVLGNSIVPDHTGDHVEANLGVVHRLDDARVDDVGLALARTVLAVKR